MAEFPTGRAGIGLARGSCELEFTKRIFLHRGRNIHLEIRWKVLLCQVRSKKDGVGEAEVFASKMEVSEQYLSMPEKVAANHHPETKLLDRQLEILLHLASFFPGVGLGKNA
ncbi:MAG: hypothetical protein LUC43_07785 [Burkholderiales bacterium]|nr:hypothetical protein [Burkholderiales bacterium]